MIILFTPLSEPQSETLAHWTWKIMHRLFPENLDDFSTEDSKVVVAVRYHSGGMITTVAARWCRSNIPRQTCSLTHKVRLIPILLKFTLPHFKTNNKMYMYRLRTTLLYFRWYMNTGLVAHYKIYEFNSKSFYLGAKVHILV